MAAPTEVDQRLHHTYYPQDVAGISGLQCSAGWQVMGKWIAGIAATIIAALAIVFLTPLVEGERPKPPPTEVTVVTPESPTECVVRGAVFEGDGNANEGIANVSVIARKYPNGDNKYLARTDSQGQFELDCPPESQFPIEFQLRKDTWCPPAVFVGTRKHMDWDATSTRVNLYVREKVYLPPPAGFGRC